MMGEFDLWLIVEGRDHDRPFYERLTQDLPSTRELKVIVRLAEQISVHGRRGGGKSHSLSIHDQLAVDLSLIQTNSKGVMKVAFLLDRDCDDYTNQLSPSPHVIYTQGADVEADILINAEIWRATESAYGITAEDTRRIAANVGDPRHALASLWRDWLLLRYTALACSASNATAFGEPSKVNVGLWGAVDPALIADVEAKILARTTPIELAEARVLAEAHLAAHFIGSSAPLLLKGKWIPDYVHHLVSTHLADQIIKVGITAGVIVNTALAALDYSLPWASHYERSFARLAAA